MTATVEQIRNGLEEMAKKHGPAVSNIAIVKSVNLQEQTCVLEDEDGIEIFDVRLKAVLNQNKSVLIEPKVGSYVLAVRVEDDDDWMVVGYDEIVSIGYYLNGVEIEFKQKLKFAANGESLAQLMQDLITAIEEMVFVTPAGNTTSLVNLTQFQQLQQRFNNFLE